MPKKVISELPEVFVSSRTLSSTVSQAVRRGELRRIASRLYTRNLNDPPEQLVRRHLYPIVAGYFPEAVVADRSARVGGPTSDGTLFLAARRTGDIEIPGFLLRARKGPPALPSDLPLPNGLHLSSTARALLENMRRSQQRGERAARTLTKEELEEWLESLLLQRGEDGLRQLRQQARDIASLLEMQGELERLDPLIGAVLGTRRVRAASDSLRARQRGQPYDPRRIELFEVLRDALSRYPPIVLPVLDSEEGRRRTLPFFEAYFSNFIEGTEFRVDEAAEIVFEGRIPDTRPEDAHDIMSTYRIVADELEMSRTPGSGDELITLLRSRHRMLFEQRPDRRPGEFKTSPNRVGVIEFVSPDLVPGTLAAGLEIAQTLTSAFARAVFQMFLVSEVHPFDDGNGRLARIMMNAELVAAPEHRIIIPTSYRNNYLMALRALTVNRRAEALIQTLAYAQRYTAAIEFSTVENAQALLEETNAFVDPAEADLTGRRIVLPSAVTVPR